MNKFIIFHLLESDHLYNDEKPGGENFIYVHADSIIAFQDYKVWISKNEVIRVRLSAAEINALITVLYKHE